MRHKERLLRSFLSRCHGVLEARSANKDRWEGAKRHFVKSLKHSPSNANALYLLGMCALELGKPQEAVSLMTKSLLLDPDFRAPYVCLGVAFLRLKHFEEAISISEACLDRHPSSPQCVYHIGVACCQLSLLITAKEAAGIPLDYQERQLLDDLRKRALASLTEARESEEGQKRKPNPGSGRVPEAPWLESDGAMIDMLAAARGMRNGLAGGYNQDAAQAREIRLPPTVGWRIFGWRT